MVDVIIPARNEQDTIGPIVDVLAKHPRIASVIVVIDADTTDNTGDIALAYGGWVINGEHSGTCGKGQCIRLGLEYVQSEYVFLCDADLMRLTPDHVSQMVERERFTIGVPDFPLSEIMMTPAVQDNPDWFRSICHTWEIISGERLVPVNVLRKIDLHGYLTEVQINSACLARGERPVFVQLKGLYSPFVMTERRIAEMQRDRQWGFTHGVFRRDTMRNCPNR
jgi:glycosyltransferase involved in cell wall biosynthesis